MKTHILAFILLVLLTSCARKIKMTGDLRAKMDEQKINYKNIQFFNRGYFTLERNITSEAMIALNGKIRMKNGLYMEKLTFKTRIPAVCDSITPDLIYIRFEKGPGKSLPFRINLQNQFELFPENTDSAGNKLINYGGLEYRLNTYDSRVILLAKRKKVNEADVNKRKVKGLRITS